MGSESLSKVSLVAYPLLLLCILGTGIAPLCAPSSGWAYYHTDHLHTLSGYRPESAWVGYVKGSGTTTMLLHRLYPLMFPEYHYLGEYGNVGHVFGWLEVAFLGLSLVLALAVLLLWAFAAACRMNARGLHTLIGPVSIIFGVILFGLSAAFYILLAVGVDKGLKFQLGVGLIPWPSWAWWLAVINSWLWISLGVTAICERKKLTHSTKYVPENASGSNPVQELPISVKA